MPEYRVEVDVATCHPPRPDATVYVEVEAETGHEAELIAAQLAACNPAVVMAVATRITDWEDCNA